MIPPSTIVLSLLEILASGRFSADIVVTLRNVMAAIVAAMLSGPLLAIILHRMPAIRRILDPLFATYYAIPVYTFYPLLMVIFGLGDLPQIAVGYLLAIVAVLINTLNSLDRVPPVLLKVARTDFLHPGDRHRDQHVAVRVGTPAACAALERTMTRWRDPLALIAFVLAAWQALYWWAGDVALTSPASTIVALAGMVQDPRFLPHVRETMLAFVQGFAIAAIVGLAIGTTLGAHRLTGEVGEPILVALYSIPKVTLYPVILLVFGIGMPAKVAFGAIQGIVPIALFSMNAIRNIRPVYTRTARVLVILTRKVQDSEYSGTFHQLPSLNFHAHV